MTFENDTNRKSAFPIYIVLMGILACIAYSHLLDLPIESEDSQYMADAETVWQNPSRLFSPENVHPGRPVVQIVFIVGHILWGKNPAAYHGLLVAFHFFASIRLFQTFKLSGANTPVSMLSGAIFLLYAASFRNLQWIETLSYPLALIFLLEIVRIYLNWPDKRPWTNNILSIFYVLLSIGTHPTAIFIFGVCAYIAYERTGSIREALLRTTPLLLVGSIGLMCLILIYPHAAQFQDMSPATGVARYFQYLGHLILYAFCLPVEMWDKIDGYWNTTISLIAGMGYAALLLYLVLKRKIPIWALWTLLALLPFITKPNFHWRYFYFATAGSSLVLGYCIYHAYTRIAKLPLPKFVVPIGGTAIIGILFASSIFAHKKAEAIALYSSGRSHLAREFLDEGIEYFTLALQKNARGIPTDAYERLSLASFGEGKNPDHILLEGLKHYPDHPQFTPELNLMLGLSMYLDDTQIAEGKAFVRKIYESSPNKGKLHLIAGTCLGNLAKYYSDNKNYEKAVTICREALVFQPNHRKALFMLVPLLFKLNRTEEAIQATRQAIDRYPQNEDMALSIFPILVEQKQYAEAEKVYRHYLTLDPQAPNSHYNLGVLTFAQGRNEEAILSLQRAIKDDPADTDAHLYLAQALEKVGQTQEAMHTYRRVLSLDPKNKIANDRVKANESPP